MLKQYIKKIRYSDLGEGDGRRRVFSSKGRELTAGTLREDPEFHRCTEVLRAAPQSPAQAAFAFLQLATRPLAPEFLGVNGRKQRHSEKVVPTQDLDKWTEVCQE